LGVEITKPVGNVSLKAMPVNAFVVLLFWIVKLRLVEPFNGMEAAPNALIITGAVTTVMEALEVLPVPPSVEVMVTELFFTPAVVPVTFTETVQDALLAIVPAERLTPDEPATPVAVPPHVLLIPLGVATTSPDGKLSVNASPVSPAGFGFVMLKVSEVEPFNGMVTAPNAFVIEGASAVTLMLAEAVPPVPPSVDVTLPVVLFLVPGVVPVTFTANVHEEDAARLAPVKLILPEAATAVIVPPPQVPVRPLGVETARPEGSVSVKPTPLSDVVVLLFWIVKLRLVEPFSGMLAAPKALIITGGESTVTDALEVLPVPASVEVIVTELFFTPAVVPCMLTETVQDALAARVPAARFTLDDPATAAAVPPHVLLMPLGVATTSPAGRLSVNASPVSETPAFGL
jgi:hypothetical protein